jgi:AraC-like DNA-binding protein
MSDSIIMRSGAKLPNSRLINSVVVMARVTARYGIDLDHLLEGTGISPDDLNDPMKLIAVRQEMAVMRNMARLLPDVPWIGIEVGKEYHFSANGKLGLAMMCCENLMDALSLAMKYIHLTNSYHQYTLRLKGGTGYGEMTALADLGELNMAVCEAEVASLQCMASLGMDETPRFFKELRFAYPRPSYSDRYEEQFRCPVVFDAPCHTIVFEPSILGTPLKFANPLVRTSMEEECRRILPLLQGSDSVAALIQRELSAQREGFPTLVQIARRINLSPRTLRRRLEEERTSYKTILADVRKCKAMDLLKSTDMTMENVAARLGFSEVSSFYRAFKSWTGKTPSRFRE